MPQAAPLAALRELPTAPRSPQAALQGLAMLQITTLAAASLTLAREVVHQLLAATLAPAAPATLAQAAQAALLTTPYLAQPACQLAPAVLLVFQALLGVRP